MAAPSNVWGPGHELRLSYPGLNGQGIGRLFVRLHASTVSGGVFEPETMAPGPLTRLNFRAYPRVRIAVHEFFGQVLRTTALSGGLIEQKR